MSLQGVQFSGMCCVTWASQYDSCMAWEMDVEIVAS